MAKKWIYDSVTSKVLSWADYGTGPATNELDPSRSGAVLEDITDVTFEALNREPMDATITRTGPDGYTVA